MEPDSRAVATARDDHQAFNEARERFFATLAAQSAVHNLEAAWREAARAPDDPGRKPTLSP